LPKDELLKTPTGAQLSLCVQFLEHMLTADLDFALVFSGLCEIIDKLHP